MTSRTDRYRALPRGARVFVVVTLATLGVVLWVALSDDEDDIDASGCGRFRALVDDVQADKVEPDSPEVLDRMEAIGDQLQDEGGDLVPAGVMATTSAQTARAFPAEADATMAAAVERVDEACS